MSKITLNDVIKEQIEADADFSIAYQRELLINAISKMVIELRQSQQITQKELAEKAGTTQPVIARLESGSNDRVPSLDLLERIAVASHARLNIEFEIMDSA